MHPSYVMQMHVDRVTCNFTEGPIAVALKLSTMIPLVMSLTLITRKKGLNFGLRTTE